MTFPALISRKNPSAARPANATRRKQESKPTSSQGRQAGEACGRDALLLDEEVEAFAHAFGEDQGFELQAGAKAICLAHTLVIEIGKIVSLPESEKKSGLCDQTEGLKTVAPPPMAEGREIDVRSKVLLTRSGVEVFAGPVIGVGQERACHVVGIEQVGRFMTVVDGQDEAAIHTAGDFGDPIAGFEADFSLLVIFQRYLLSREIFTDGASGKWHGQFGEACAITGDEDF